MKTVNSFRDSDAELTALANVVMARAGQPSGDGLFLRESERRMVEGADW